MPDDPHGNPSNPNPGGLPPGWYLDFEGTARPLMTPGMNFQGGSGHFMLFVGPDGKVYPAVGGYSSTGQLPNVSASLWAENQPWWGAGPYQLGGPAGAPGTPGNKNSSPPPPPGGGPPPNGGGPPPPPPPRIVPPRQGAGAAGSVGGGVGAGDTTMTQTQPNLPALGSLGISPAPFGGGSGKPSIAPGFDDMIKSIASTFSSRDFFS